MNAKVKPKLMVMSIYWKSGKTCAKHYILSWGGTGRL